MARIRSIKPEYFRHELLQDLERDYPALHPMLVFAGLWGQCDKNGVFEYKPRQLKLDILPFLDYDISSTLGLLIGSGMIVLMEYVEAHGKHQGSTTAKVYGYIPTFKDHQRINGTESKAAAKNPQPTEMKEHHPVAEVGEALGKHQGSTQEAGEGKGREGKGKEGNTTTVSEISDLYRKYAGVNQINGGQVVVFQDFIKAYSLEAIEDSFRAAAASSIPVRSFLNWAKTRLDRTRDAPQPPTAENEGEKQIAYLKSLGCIE